MGVINFNKPTFRRLSLTIVRIVRAVKFVFAERSYVPAPINVKKWQKDVLAEAYGQSLPSGHEISKPLNHTSVNSLVERFENCNVRKMQPWCFSSTYTMAYFLWKL